MMTASDILRAWELGAARSPVERAIAMLACAWKDRSADELAALPIGRRDALLFTLRERTFGRALHGFADCPRCGGRLRFSTSTSELRVSPPSDGSTFESEAQHPDGWRLRFRLPDSRDLLAASYAGELGRARGLLIGRCLLSCVKSDGSPAATELSDELMTFLAARMAEQDPQAEVLLAMSCPGCEHPFNVLFDIAEYLWREVDKQARSLIEEVHTLGRVYGWAEAEILAMSDSRRRLYLDLVGQGSPS